MQEPNAMQCNSVSYHASFAVSSTPVNEKASHMKTNVTAPRSAPIFISHVVTFDRIFRHLAKKLLDILYPLKLLLFVVHHAQGRRSAINQISTVNS